MPEREPLRRTREHLSDGRAVFLNRGDRTGDFIAEKPGVHVRMRDGWTWVAETKLDYLNIRDAERYGW